MKTAVITAIGSFSADAVISTLKKHGVFVIGCDIFPKEWVVNAYCVDQFYQVPRGVEAERYLTALRIICTKHKVDYLIPSTDAEIDTLNENRTWFETHNVRICLSPKETIDICRDKYQTYKLLQENAQNLSIKTIPTVFGSALDETDAFKFPMLCKPIHGRSSQGLKRIYQPKELAAILESIDLEAYIFQPLISGAVIAVDIIRDVEGKNVYSIPRKELLRTGNGAGTSVHVFHDPVLDRECAKIAEYLNILGCVNFEFIRSDNGEYFFLECNPRFSGGIAFSCMAGYDFIWNHLRCFAGQQIEPMTSYQDCYIARKYEQTITSVG